MGHMKLGKAIGWGVCIYAVMHLVWDGFTLYGFVQGFLPRLCGILVLVIMATIAGRSLRFASWRDILPYSFVWTVIIALFDAVYSVPFIGWQLYADWSVWVGYALVTLVPLLAPYTRPHFEQ